MIFEPEEPPREFTAGSRKKHVIRDCGSLHLGADEQVTFVTESGGEYDVTRKDWGFYATPSLNGRLAHFGLRAVLAKSETGRYFVLLVERGMESSFDSYVRAESLTVVAWMDSAEALRELADRMASGNA